MARTSIKVNIASHLKCDSAFRKLFHKILIDYCKRFGVKVQPKAWDVNITIADYSTESGAEGVTTSLENKIIMQIKDPYMDVKVEGANKSLDHYFMTIVCHEMVHACQHMTGREGIKLKIDRLDDPDGTMEEDYFFDPAEVEARVLDELYVRYTPEIIWKKLQENYEDEDS
jgi:hypothetical protein